MAVFSNSTTRAYAASLLVKQGSGRLFGFCIYNSKASAQFIQVYDAVGLPADASIPTLVYTVSATSNFAVDYGTDGRAFSNGIVICNSSTGPTKTIGSADCWIDAQYGE